MKHASLSELAMKLGINKSKLSYYFSLGLLKPIAKVGRMNIFDSDETLKVIKSITSMKTKGIKLGKIKDKLN